MSETIERTFPVTSPANLNLRNIRGSVEIRPAEDGIIRVTATKDTGTGDASRTLIEFSQASDGTVEVSTRFPDGAWSWLIGSFPCRVDYVVQAPPQCSLKIHGVSSRISAAGFEGQFSFESVSGEMDLRSLSGPVRVNTVSGEMELADLTGDLHLTTVSGKVIGKRISGPVKLNTVSGAVAMQESSLASVDATTVSGGMVYQTGFGAGPYRFNSVSGDVKLVVPPDSRCSAEMHAVSGHLSTQLPATSEMRGNGNQSVEVQGGGVRVYLHSVSGNLSLAS